MYICLNCGNRFEHPKKIQEDRGEFWGVPCWETMYYSPCCEDDYDEEDEEDEEEDIDD